MTEHVARKAAPAPAGLGKAGKRLWRDIAGVYQLRPDELQVLENAARTGDLIVRLQDELEQQSELVTEGSMGQTVVTPLATEVRMQRQAQTAMLKGLNLPDLDDDGTVPAEPPKSAQHQAAAHARWNRRKANLALAGRDG
jgi:hypothetical protein